MLNNSSSSDYLPVANPENIKGIVYGLVARDRFVVVEYSPLTGNFTTVARLILEKLPQIPIGQKRSYAYDQFIFHYYAARTGVTFLCLADKTVGRESPYRFLDEIGGRWSADMSAEIAQSLLKREMENANKSNVMARVQSQIAQVSESMVENIDKIIARQEKIELLVEKTDALDRTAAAFRREAGDLRRAVWWRSVRWKFYLVAIVATLFFCLWYIYASQPDHKQPSLRQIRQ